MVQRGYFAHTAPNGTDMVTRVRQSGFLHSASNGYTLAEDIGWGSKNVSTPRSQVQMWMNSAGHRFNILYRSFKKIGIGVVPGTPRKVGQPGATYTTDFGVRF
jgi:uncharacterized protein YkwD